MKAKSNTGKPGKVTTWNWGFSYLCPHCRAWTAYHSATAQPKFLSYTIDYASTRRRPKALIARFDCETCGADLSIEVAEFEGAR